MAKQTQAASSNLFEKIVFFSDDLFTKQAFLT